MKKIKYLLFSLLCIFTSSIVFAANEVVIKSITPVYDEDSTIVVNEDNSVVFNDKDQVVEYKVVLENTTDKDLPIESITLSKPSEDFLVYELEGLDNDDVLKAKSDHEVIVSLSTIKKEGWGRNFNDELTASINIDSSVLNPNTSTMGIVIILVIVTFFTVILITTVKSKKISRYVALIITFGSIISVTKAKESLVLPIKINVSYESQNVMAVVGKMEVVCWEECCDDCRQECDDEEDRIGCEWICDKECWEECDEVFVFKYFWKYRKYIKNIYFEDEFNEIKKYAHKFDVSEKQDGKVVAYLVTNKETDSYYDLYLQADGIIYPNNNASYYFAEMYNLERINNIEVLDTSNVINMSNMFNSTGYNSETFTLDVSNLDTKNVTDMSNMFNRTGYNSENFGLDVSNFDTSQVTDMGWMFYETGYNSTKLNTSITIMNPNTKIYYDMFKHVATQPGAQIIVNYTSETSDLVDEMINTSTPECLVEDEYYDEETDNEGFRCLEYDIPSNVVKGVQVN